MGFWGWVYSNRIMWRYSLILAVLCQLGTNAVSVVNTGVGEIHGFPTQVVVAGSTYTVNKYLGIPYAEPPVGDLRFRKPVPRSSLASPYFATEFGHICPQIAVSREHVDGVEDEDCLFLNVYVPERVADRTDGHAVMVWIYGGAFILGSSDTYDVEHLAAYGNVIYVTINYRLGPLGFLSTGDENCAGNFGLWDQRLALQWIKDNIAAFGGDVNRITVFGQSAGAVSATIHAMYPENQGLFQRIISQSGVAAVKFINMSRDMQPLVNAIAKNLGCELTDNAKIVQCMRKFSWQRYMEVINNMYLNPDLILFMLFDPVVDGDYIRHDLKRLRQLSEDRQIDELEFYRSVDVINGFCEYEGGVSMQFFTNGEELDNFRPTQEDMVNSLIPMATSVFYQRMFSPNINRLIAHVYTNWSDPYNYETIRNQYAGIHGDAGFSVPAVATSLLHAAGGNGNSYMYTFLPVPTHRFPTTPSWLPGADHGDETQFVLGAESQTGVAEWEKQLSAILMTYWSNFAKTGNPNSLDGRGPTWKPYTVDDQHYMELDRNMGPHSSRQFLLADKTHFWEDVLPALVMQHDESGTSTCGVTSSGTMTIPSLLMLLSALLYFILN